MTIPSTGQNRPPDASLALLGAEGNEAARRSVLKTSWSRPGANNGCRSLRGLFNANILGDMLLEEDMDSRELEDVRAERII